MSELKEILKEKVEKGKEVKQAVSISAPIITRENDSPNGIEGEIVEISHIPNIEVNLKDAKGRIEELQAFIKYMMVPNIDYGFVSGCPKPMLFKSGAEKLCDIYGFTKQIAIIEKTENWEIGIFHYVVKAILINKRTGLIESEGIGACNSKEKKFASQDAYSIVNNILKMAKKRAIVDATLAATRTSGIFAQDMENM